MRTYVHSTASRTRALATTPVRCAFVAVPKGGIIPSRKSRHTAALLWGSLMLLIAATSAADMVSTEQAAANAMDTFTALQLTPAEITGTTAYLVYRPDTEAALQASVIDAVPEEHLVLIIGKQKRREWASRFVADDPLLAATLDAINTAHDAYLAGGGDRNTCADYEKAFGLPSGALRREDYTHWQEEEGIVGTVRTTPATGTAYEVAAFTRAQPRLSGLAIAPPEAEAAVEAAGAKTLGAPRLVEILPDSFVWQCQVASGLRYVDARTGLCLSEAEMNEKGSSAIREQIAATNKGLSGTTPRYFTLAPVFEEQGMHQYQYKYSEGVPGGFCGPTSLSMLLDYWGETVPFIDVADVAMPNAAGGALLSDLERATLFSHVSMGKWDHLNDGFTGLGYGQRVPDVGSAYGYSVVRGHFKASSAKSGDEGEGEGEAYGGEESTEEAEEVSVCEDACAGNPDAWESLKGLVGGHCPFMVDIYWSIGGHYVVVAGYADDAGDENPWVTFVNPANESATACRMMRWCLPEPDCSYSFYARWKKADYVAIVPRPMPVDIEFLPATPEQGKFTLRARVRTCEKHPLAGNGGAWTYVNRNTILSGGDIDSGFLDQQLNRKPIPIHLTYPEQMAQKKLSGDNEQGWVANTADDETTDNERPEWVFVQDGTEKGCEFGVEARGWAAEYYSALYVGRAHPTASIALDDEEFSIAGAGTTLTVFANTSTMTLSVADITGFPPAGTNGVTSFFVKVSDPASSTVNVETMLVDEVVPQGNNTGLFHISSRAQKASGLYEHVVDSNVVLDNDLGVVPYYISVDIHKSPRSQYFEVMKVTDQDGTSLTVERGKAGTSAKAHAQWAEIQTYNADEVFGWDTLRIDSKIVRVVNTPADAGEPVTVAAFGDQGNLYLAGHLYEWQAPEKLTPSISEGDFLLSNVDTGEVFARIDNTGSMYTRAGWHAGMDDVHDACDQDAPRDPDASEHYYLEHPPSSAISIA